MVSLKQCDPVGCCFPVLPNTTMFRYGRPSENRSFHACVDITYTHRQKAVQAEK